MTKVRFASVLLILLGSLWTRDIVQRTESYNNIALLFANAVAQTKPKQTQASGPITGVVLTTDGLPAPDVTVVLQKLGGTWRDQVSTSTGDDGTFRFDNVASGVYTVLAYGSIAELQSRICRPGDSLELRVRMGKDGVITGRVTDAKGESAIEAPVRAIMVRDAKGRLLGPGNQFRRHAHHRWTDDRGIYRLWGLPPGSYLVAAGGKNEYTHEPGPYDDQPLTYYLSSPLSGAREVIVHEGGERAGVDITMRSDPGYAINGTVSGSFDGTQDGGVGVMLSQVTTGAMEARAPIRDPQQSREFSFGALTAGEYELQAMAVKGTSFTAASSVVRVTIKDSDVRGVDLKLKPLGSVSIGVTIEPTPVPSPKECENPERLTIAQILVTAHPDGESQLARSQSPVFYWLSNMGLGTVATPEANGLCRLAPIEAGRYRVEVDPANDHYYVHSITKAASDMTGRRVDIAKDGVKVSDGEHVTGVAVKLAAGAAKLSGQVSLWRGAAISPSALRVFLVPAERESADDVLRFAEASVSARGEFTFKHVKPGGYFLVARPVSEEPGGTKRVWWDAEGRAQLRREAEESGRFPWSNPPDKRRIELRPCARVHHLLTYDK